MSEIAPDSSASKPDESQAPRDSADIQSVETNPREWIPNVWHHRRWLLIGLLVVLGAFAVGAWWGPGVETAEADRSGDPQVAFAPVTPTAIPTLEILLPTPTPTMPPTEQTSPEAVALAEVAAPPALAIVLPTVTPTPVPPPIAPRAVEVSGQANLRMQIAGEGFQSGGRPLQIPVEDRTYRLDDETRTLEDRWCIQMGVVNLELTLNLELIPATSAVRATGTAELYDDFCFNRGALKDTTAIDLHIPADARLQSTHNLFGERKLLNMSGLLDMDTGVILELRSANLRPQE